MKDGLCKRCNRTRKIYAKEMCKSCYNMVHLDREKLREYTRAWLMKRPNYFREYYKKHKSIMEVAKENG